MNRNQRLILDFSYGRLVCGAYIQSESSGFIFTVGVPVYVYIHYRFICIHQNQRIRVIMVIKVNKPNSLVQVRSQLNVYNCSEGITGPLLSLS